MHFLIMIITLMILFLCDKNGIITSHAYFSFFGMVGGYIAGIVILINLLTVKRK